MLSDLGKIGQMPMKRDFDPLKDANEGGNILECKRINNGIENCGFLLEWKT